MDAFSFAAEEAFELDHLCFRKIKTKKNPYGFGFHCKHRNPHQVVNRTSKDEAD